MQTKRTVTFFSVLLLLAMLPCSVSASSDRAVSFRGSGVTIDLTYPEEAPPNSTITYNITITATTEVTSININIFIYAPVNSTLQLAKNQPFNWGTLHENQSLPTSEIPIPLPEQTNGTLYFNMTVQTEIDTTPHYSAYSLYTTVVSEPTLSEMRVLYYEMLANYTGLQEDYEALLEEYNGLLVNYSSLLANYTALLTEHDGLSRLYADQVSVYQKKLAEYNALLDDYNNLHDDFESKSNELVALQTEFNNLTDTQIDLQGNYTALETNFEDLNASYTVLLDDFENIQNSLYDKQGELNSDRIVMIIFVISCAVLIAFIVYLKRKKEDPYLVIRKETVSMKSNKET
jgi:hypothetical protein